MARPEAAIADLVPLADRIRWMLTYRAAVVALLPVGAVASMVPGPAFGRPFLVGLAWLAMTALTVPVSRLGRGLALSAFSFSLFGDGLLLGALRPWLGWVGGLAEILVVGHVVAVTLLASFRTGAKVTLWHVLVGFTVVEARAAGLLGSPAPIDVIRFVVVMTLLWLVMAATASFAAVNERELRRRRYDAERLHAFGVSVARSLEPAGVAERLAEFARDELLARRVAVVIYPGGMHGPGGMAYLLDGRGERELTVAAEPARRSVLRKAMQSNVTALANRLSPEQDTVLATLLPNAHQVIIVPFEGDEARGVLVLEHTRWSSQRNSRRVELRVIDTAEQATTLACLAVGRALLLAQARASANTDGLTGLANRRAFDDRLAAESTRATAGGQPVALVMIDLDHFKRLNDQHGHQTGDDVLQRVAQVLREQAPAGSLAARYGGEELALILPGLDIAGGADVAERVRAAIASAPGPVPVTASLGVAAAPRSGRAPADLLAAADQALYEAKRRGRDRVARAEPQEVAA